MNGKEVVVMLVNGQSLVGRLRQDYDRYLEMVIPAEGSRWRVMRVPLSAVLWIEELVVGEAAELCGSSSS